MDTKSCFYKNHYLFLFFALILSIILNPYFQSLNYGKWLFNITIYLISLLAIVSLKQNKFRFIIGFVLGSISVLSSLLYETLLTWNADLFRIVFALLFFSFVSFAVFVTILKEREVTQNLIFAALCAYLFIGISYAQLYSLIELIAPNSFGPAHAVDMVQHSFSFHYLYFSFTVLTTVGFGDVVPNTAYAKSIVIVEEVTGVFYMAIFVSRLIAAEKKQKNDILS